MNSRLLLVICLTFACGGRAPSTTGGETESGEGSSGASSEASETSTMKLDVDGDNDCLTDDDCPAGYSCVSGWCEMACGSAEVWLEAPRTPFIWIVDRSASMATPSWDHDDDPATPLLSRWAQARHFIETVSTQYGGSLSFGVKLVPGDSACAEADADCYEPSACSVPSSVEWIPDPIMPTPPDQYLPLLPPADATSELRGGSPLSAGLWTASEEGANDLGIEPVYVLVTDGVATCADGSSCEAVGDCPLLEAEDDSVLATIESLVAEQKHVLVVAVGRDDQPSGVPYDEPVVDRGSRLQSWALAGGETGVDDAFDAADPDAFISFGSGYFWPGSYLPSCAIDLSSPPNMPPNDDQIDLLECYVGDDDEALPYKPELNEEDCINSPEPAWTWLEPGLNLMLCGMDCPGPYETSFRLRCDYGCPEF
jgi:hypothetical protein